MLDDARRPRVYNRLPGAECFSGREWRGVRASHRLQGPNPVNVSAQLHAEGICRAVAAQLQGTGKYTPEEAEIQGRLFARVLSSLATRAGVDPSSLYARYRIQIEAADGNPVYAAAITQDSVSATDRTPAARSVADTGMDTSPPVKPEARLSDLSEITGSQEFKRWFGDSKVVDANGKPLVVYHGTRADFDVFDAQRVGDTFGKDREGFFFTGSTRDASWYAAPQFRFGSDDTSGANIMPVYLSIRNPLTLARLRSARIPVDRAFASGDAENVTDLFDEYHERILALARKGGHDGIVLRRGNDLLAVAFRPEQIKSATANRGTFDPNDPNILYQRAAAPGAGPHETAEFKLWFGDSKVVDENGRPLVVYHGTRWDITEFRPQSWFAEDAKVAHAFIGGDRRSRPKARDGSQMLPVYLSIKKPLDLTRWTVAENATLRDVLELAGVDADAAVLRLESGSRERAARALRESGISEERITRMLGDVALTSSQYSGASPLWHWLDDPEIIAILREQGFDGVKTREAVVYNETLAEGRRYNRRRDSSVSGVTWLAFDSTQVKSATGNRGTFDPNDPNILFQRAVAPEAVDPYETAEFKRWFARSKVVDESGKPRVVYHGTPETAFDTFDMDMAGDGDFGPGFYFASERKVAEGYASRSWVRRDEVPREGRVIEAYLKIENPATNAVLESDEVAEIVEDTVDMNGEALRDYLEGKGYDGIAFTHSGGEVEYVVFKPEQIKSATANRGTFDPGDPSMLRQSGLRTCADSREPGARTAIGCAGQADETGCALRGSSSSRAGAGDRGALLIGQDRSMNVLLFPPADLTTFLHESAHVFLEMLRDVAAEPGADPSLAADFDAVLRWGGVRGATPEQRRAVWDMMRLDQQRDVHEAFAEAFERYLQEGQAPEPALAGLFARFRRWVTDAYRGLRELRLPLTPEVRQVMDRLVGAERFSARDADGPVCAEGDDRSLYAGPSIT